MSANNICGNISEYSYELTDDRIAKYPLKNRDESKILIYKKGKIIDDTFKNCTQYIPENALVIFNNTKVIHARILMQKDTGAHIEILCLEPHAPSNYEQSFATTHSCTWKCVVGNAKKWKNEPLNAIIPAKRPISFQAIKGEATEDGFLVTFIWDGNITFSEILDIIGKIPIPPYLNRESEEDDNTRYQTIYAERSGSVAAPTAGLHFTEQVLDSFKKHNIEIGKITLHVGAGTFKPVKEENYAKHTMHQELCIVKRDIIVNILSHINSIVAVGTTSVRTLESLYWIGVKLTLDNNTNIEHLGQWDVYDLPQNIRAEQALSSIIRYMDNHRINEIRYYTQIMITPTYSFKLAHAMFTNFHQPQSTLLLLISSFVGDAWKSIYNHALSNGYRFLSYGDSSLLIP